MPADTAGDTGLTVVAGDVLALRGTGLAAAETWALLCQAAQALQDLFLSNGGVVGGSRMGPVVTPHTLELTPRGRVLLQQAPPETARAYLPPEYRPGRLYSDTDSEKMWMYSLGRALLDTTPRVAAFTGTVSVSPSSALQSVLAAMTEPDPRRRATLMNLLDVISEYCRTRLQSKPFTHTVMDMYREVLRSPQYAARKRAAYHRLNSIPQPINSAEQPQHNQRQNHIQHHQYSHRQDRNQLPQQQRHPSQQQSHQNYTQPQQQLNQNSNQVQPPINYHYRQLPQHQQNQHRAQVQNHNHYQQQQLKQPISQYHQYQQQQQQLQQQQQHQQNNYQNTMEQKIQQQNHYVSRHHHGKGALFKAQSRNSQSHPNLTALGGIQQQQQFQSQLEMHANRPVPMANQQQSHYHVRTNSQPVYSQQAKSSGNLQSMLANDDLATLYSDPIYSLPVKPFLSSQDVRVNGLSAKPSDGNLRQDDPRLGAGTAGRYQANGVYSQPDMTAFNDRMANNGYGPIDKRSQTLQRQRSNPQLPNREVQQELKRYSQPCLVDATGKEDEQTQQQNPVSSMKIKANQGPPKPPRIITTLRKSALSDTECSQSDPPAKPPRNLVRNGPRARRGKAVQRAPSRLYRAVGGPARSFNKAQCIGPEFVVRANQPAKTLCVGPVKVGNSNKIVVIMLTGQRLEVTCDPQKITAGDLFQAIVQAEGLEENFTLGLAVLLAGDFAMLPPDTKLNKVAPPGWLSSGKSKGLLGLPTSFMLYLRLRFFLPSLRGIRNWISKHLLYLQIRRCILEQQLVCPFNELVNLTGLALQAEFGNYNANEHGCGDYFLFEHYIPESLILSMDQQSSGGHERLRVQLHEAHRERRGLDPNNAEEMFITHAQSLPDYGSHYYIATVDIRELEKAIAIQRKRKRESGGLSDCSRETIEDIYEIQRQEKCSNGVELSRLDSFEKVPRTSVADERKQDRNDKLNCGIHVTSKSKLSHNGSGNMNSSNSNKCGKANKPKKTESNVWLAIHAQGLKLFERGGEPRERKELIRFHWKDIQTLSYSKSCLVVYSKLNGKRCKFKLRMDHRKSYFAFKLTSLHHQFYLRLRSELTSLQSLAKDFGVEMLVEPKTSPSKKNSDSKTKITIANTVKNQRKSSYPLPLEEYQNKENENPQKDSNAHVKETAREQAFYSSEEDALYAQVNVRLEPEGESRDSENENERCLRNSEVSSKKTKLKRENLDTYAGFATDTEIEYAYTLPKITCTDVDSFNNKCSNPEDLYAAINKVGLPRKDEFPVPEEVWDVTDVQKSLTKMKTSSLPNYGTSRQSSGYRTPSLPRRLGVKMGTRAIYSSLVQKDAGLTDDAESVSMKSETASSIRSLSARSAESPCPEAYVLNADIRTDNETFRVPEDESMSASLMARLEELSFAEERILHTIKLERGHGGSIGLQVTEGNDGGVYVQAVSVGGSADMAGNVNKGDRIVAINGQSLLNLGYEDALKMLQSSSETVELVLSQPEGKNIDIRPNQEHGVIENNYLHDIRFDVSSEVESSNMAHKWLGSKTTDVASVQNTSSAYSSAASSAMGNHNTNAIYLTDLVDSNDLKSASVLLSIEDFDVSRTSRQVFI